MPSWQSAELVFEAVCITCHRAWRCAEPCRRLCRYFQACSEAQIALAKSKGLFTTGVQFVDEVGRQLRRKTVWRHPQASKGEVRHSPIATLPAELVQSHVRPARALQAGCEMGGWLQVYLTTVQIEMGLPFDAAQELMETNLSMMEEYGSRIKQTEVGFYVKRAPDNQLDTGKDFICLVTGLVKQGNDGQAHTGRKVLQRWPWARTASRHTLGHLKNNWKRVTNEKAAKALWAFWYKCASPVAACMQRARGGPRSSRR